MTRFGDGLSVNTDLALAAERAVEQALEPLAADPDLVCVFVSPGEGDAAGAAGAVEAAARRASRLCSGTTLIGCSASGVIGANRGVEGRPAVSAWAAVLPGVQVRSYHLEVIRLPEGMAVVGMPERQADDEVGVLLADPYSFPADGFVQQTNEALEGLPIVGGLATGHDGPGSTRLFLDDRVVDRGAVGVVLSGPVGAHPIVTQGCRPIGPPMVVTKADGNAVLELAGTPAVRKLEEIVATLDPLDQALVSAGLQFGLAMDEYAEEHGHGDFLVRGIIGVDRERGAIVVGDVVEVGRTVCFQVRDAGAAEDHLRELLGECRSRTGGQVDGALLVSCVNRGTQLFGDADHDVLTVRRMLECASVGGFFAAGEFGPVAGRNHLHGSTASILVFGPPPGGRVARP